MQAGLLLIALAFGYKVFTEASSSAKKSVKQIGRIIGIYIMIVSFLGSICTTACAIQYGKMNCAFKGEGFFGKKMCPIAGHGGEMSMMK